ncbi:hypothetical protein GWI33_015439 [Rhynchophorus ferrugineus]|uniref:C2H2-type domain-containing protein n=1 Tax=Rhynchophorus ferrugineus TaxID=354439 RepID=A0A834HZT2_RHYFE|nr:hypothetical protein GWI33_015439 [Rhynchophorus ferrugineus]
MDNVPVICRLCLSFIEKDAYAPLQKNNSVLQSLNLISFSTIKNLQLTKNPVICKCCTTKLTELATFKESIIANEFKIQCNKKNDPKSFLCSISEDINKICRLCLKVPLNLKDLLISWKDSKVLLHNCNIHLNSDIAIPSKICLNCDRSLKKLGEFIVECTYNEKKIHNCASERGTLDSTQLIELFKIDDRQKAPSCKMPGKNSIIEYLPEKKRENSENQAVNQELSSNNIGNMDENNKLYCDTVKSQKSYRTYRRANCSTLKNNIIDSLKLENVLEEINEKLSASTEDIDIEEPDVLNVTLGSSDDYDASNNGLQDLSDILDPNETVDNEEPSISIEECNDHCIIVNIQLQAENSNTSECINVPDSNSTTKNSTTVNVKPQIEEVNLSSSTLELEPRKLRNKRKRSDNNTQDVPIKRKNLKLDLDKKTEENNAVENNIKNNVKADVSTVTADGEIVKIDSIKASTSVTPKKVGRPPKRRGRPPKQDKSINKPEEKPQEVSSDNTAPKEDQSSSSHKHSEPENATSSCLKGSANESIKKEVNAKPFEVTIIRRNKRTTNKAELDKTWQKLTGKSVDEHPKEAPVKVLKKRGRKPNPNKVVPPKAEYFVCPCCPFKTISQNSFVQHQYIHSVIDNVASFKCNQCHFKTSNEELLKQHEATHSAASLMYKCIFCDYSNHKKKISIMNHILNRHEDKDVATLFYCTVLNQDTMDEYFECFQCNFQHPEEAVMPDHVIDHSRAVKTKNPLVAKYECNLCMYRTKTEELLERHKELRHSKKNKINSKEEMIKIKEEAPEDGLYKCDLCPYKTLHKRSLSNHKSRKHFRKPCTKKETGETYYCAECSYTTPRKVNLARHALVHKTKHNMEFFECTHCYFETKHRRSYTRHMEVRHQVIV